MYLVRNGGKCTRRIDRSKAVVEENVCQVDSVNTGVQRRVSKTCGPIVARSLFARPAPRISRAGYRDTIRRRCSKMQRGHMLLSRNSSLKGGAKALLRAMCQENMDTIAWEKSQRHQATILKAYALTSTSLRLFVCRASRDRPSYSVQCGFALVCLCGYKQYSATQGNFKTRESGTIVRDVKNKGSVLGPRPEVIFNH